MHSVSHRRAMRSAAIAIVAMLGVRAAAQEAPPAAAPPDQAPATQEPSSPLTIRLGDAELLFGGFIDATAIRRDANTGSGLGTSFGTIPFANTVQGHMNDTQFSSQNSRLSLQATSRAGAADLKATLEVDFLGSRMRSVLLLAVTFRPFGALFWGRYRRGAYEFLAGQSWSLMMPNRDGLSPETTDVFFGQTVDPNYQMGLTWGRTMQFRFTAHPNDVVAAGVSVENPDQYVGSGVKLPAAFPSGEVDTGAAVNDIPNHLPDIVGKIAFDWRKHGAHQHVDAAVLVRSFKSYDLTRDAAVTATATGGAFTVAVEPVKPVRLIGIGFYSSGGGRYLANTNLPDFIVNADAGITLVTTASYVIGTEIQAAARVAPYAYYSEARARQAVASDADGTPIGFGIPGSTAANERIVEATAGVAYTFFRDPKIGGMQLLAQYSHLRRTPFSVPAGTPADASLNMLYFNLRYFLP
jgi:hypothetical protein